MRILFTICGRAGSKGVKNKNIREFLGYPLPYYTLSAIDLCIQRNPQHQYVIAINTDSNELKKIIVENKKRDVLYIERKDELGRDDTPKIAVIADTLDGVQNYTNMHFDMVVDLDITSPLRTVSDIENLVSTKEREGVDVVFSVTESRRNPYFNMVKESNGYYNRVICSQFNTRQAAPEIFDMNASLYAYTPEFLLSGKGIFDGKCKIIRMKDTGVLDIDSEEDFELMEIIAKYLFSKSSDYEEVIKNIQNLTKKENHFDY
ncbi:MAG: acylneuraminate cytidylyltransferase family protein [Bacteroidia bacterium]|nr:acylneuraminate cytidylyltransferase family protein [Bacteroidia bacterium]